MVAAIVSVSLTTGEQQSPHYAALPSGLCEYVGMRPIYTLTECLEASRSLNFRWEWKVETETDYKDQPDSCVVRDEQSVNGVHTLFAQKKGSCRIGPDASPWIPELHGRANCKCSRFSPCICGVNILIANCPGGKLGKTKISDFDGNFVGSRKYFIT